MKVAIIFVFAISTILAGTQASVLNSKQLAKLSPDDYFDDLVDAIEESMIGGGYNDIALPTVGFEFTIRIGIVNQKGTVQCGQGFLRGMQTMRKSSSASIVPIANGEYRVTITLVIPKASIGYTCSASFMGVNYSFTVSGAVENATVKLVLIVDKSGGARVEEFSQSGSGSSNFNVSGMPSLLQPITDQLTKLVGDTAAGIITQVIRQTIAGFVGEAVADTLFPLPEP